MSLEQWADLAQIVGSIGVILSLMFVGLQVRQNTAALQRDEHNSTMAQWTVVRMAVAQHRDIAEIMTAGLRGEKTLDAADEYRLDRMLDEQLWAAFHIWDRMQRGVFRQGTFELTAGPTICDLLSTVRGRAWWASAKNSGFLPEYVSTVDALLAKSKG